MAASQPIRVLVRLALRPEGGEALIEVADNGEGIPAEALGRVFEMFEQVDAQRDQARGGLGIGLALVRGLVALHGGRVEAYSEGPGKGSEFTVWLPLEAETATWPPTPPTPPSAHSDPATASR